MKNIKKIFPIIMLLCSFNLWANPHREAAFELLDLMNFETTMSNIADIMLKQAKQISPLLAKDETAIKEFLYTCLIKDNCYKNKTADVYQDFYTIEELHKLIEMIKEYPVLNKFISSNLEIINRLSSVSEEIILKNQGLLTTILNDCNEKLSEDKNCSSSDSEDFSASYSGNLL